LNQSARPFDLFLLRASIGASGGEFTNMSRSIRSILTFATVSLNSASSAFALDFGQPSIACYGQVIDGYDETIFSYHGRYFSFP
jgi:hypothetical protein